MKKYRDFIYLTIIVILAFTYYNSTVDIDSIKAKAENQKQIYRAKIEMIHAFNDSIKKNQLGLISNLKDSLNSSKLKNNKALNDNKRLKRELRKYTDKQVQSKIDSIYIAEGSKTIGLTSNQGRAVIYTWIDLNYCKIQSQLLKADTTNLRNTLRFTISNKDKIIENEKRLNEDLSVELFKTVDEKTDVEVKYAREKKITRPILIGVVIYVGYKLVKGLL